MNDVKLSHLSVLAAAGALMITLSFIMTAFAGPPTMPHTFYGEVTISSELAGAGENVTVKSAGTYVKSDLTNENGVYQLGVPIDYDYVQFYVNGTYTGDNFAVGASGEDTRVDLSVSYDMTDPEISIDPVTSPTSSSTQTVTGTVTDDVSSYEDISVTVDGTSVSLSPDNTFSQEVTLTEGSNTITVEAADNAGNTASSSVTIVLDTTAPLISITSPSDGASFASGSVNVAWTASDTGTGVDNFKYRIDSGSWTTEADNTVNSHNFTGLDDGSHTVEVRAVDYTGNSSEDNVTFTVDTTAPSISGFSVDTSETSATVTFTTDEDADTAVTVDGTTKTDVSKTDHSMTFTGLTEDTEYSVHIVAEDSLGNESTYDDSFTTSPAPTVVSTYKTGDELSVDDVGAAVDDFNEGTVVPELGRSLTRSDIEDLVDQLFRVLYG